MMENPFFSIIVPVYNKERYIANTLDTILQQDFTSFEILAIDDGSTDRSASIIQNIHDERIIYIHQNNQGVSAARNRGIQEAKGEWIMFLDADDELEQNCLHIFNELIHKYPNYYIYLGNFRMIYSDFTRIVCKYKKEAIIKKPYKAVWFEWAKMRPGNAAISSQIIKNKIQFDTRLTLFEDFDFERQLLSLYAVVYTPQIVMNYRGEYGELNHGKCPIQKVWGLNCPYYSMENFYFKLQAYKVLLSILHIRQKTCDNPNESLQIQQIMDMAFGSKYMRVYKCAYTIKRIINFVFRKAGWLQ